ncbi:glycerol kinase GlpK [Alteriqipengyuania flavescens]|uniref:glycerol kinase GlpK n=1 Tax=Alteriqipengyuania flavescens TaxID=3053610 RepID=UPI0025B449BF|nr:glycerol kinase GlpK [Alteriqipengyuania flavescens]WJY17565.1 glycerol kinase GlpK [Alteriqipengyuania flavescens]WJY23508.1 glycerol kinase GlpK [Alteriqipengyuania flavescens]
MSDPLILVLDAGTTSTRAMLFDPQGQLHHVSQAEITQHYPRDGWVEHDAGEIWQATLACAQECVEWADGNDRIACIGITNQRETVVAWDTSSGEPLARAIVWQDRRTTNFCAELKDQGHEDEVQRRTGLLLDPYFSGTKMRWLLHNVDAVKAAADAGRLALGTVESWLVWKLSGGAAHVTDASNASRTLLMPLDGGDWAQDLCDLMDVPRAALPRIVDNAGALAETAPRHFGTAIPITGLVGDQQGATIGQGCLSPGETKATYGTGAFILANHGTTVPQSRHRLLGTVLYQHEGERTYALEGAVFVAGSLIQWLRDGLGIIDKAADTERLAASVEGDSRVVIVPALAGLGAPYWRPEARGVISGLSFSTGRAHIARAALEAMAHQTRDLAEAFAADGAEWTRLRIDGGMSANDWMARDIAGLLGIPVERPGLVETTALGAAMLAAVGAGLHADLQGAYAAMGGTRTVFEPAMDEDIRKARLDRWGLALAAS